MIYCFQKISGKVQSVESLAESHLRLFKYCPSATSVYCLRKHLSLGDAQACLSDLGKTGKGEVVREFSDLSLEIVCSKLHDWINISDVQLDELKNLWLLEGRGRLLSGVIPQLRDWESTSDAQKVATCSRMIHHLTRREEVQSWCQANGIRRDQIYYEKSTRKYCKESQAQVVEFSRRNRAAITGARILHDHGGSFKKDSEFILLVDGADLVVPLPSEQHGELSVLDNKLNAVAKQMWRQHRHNGDFSWDAFLLFVELHQVGQDSIESWWKHNFLLDAAEVTLGAVLERLNAVNGKRPIRQDRADYYDQCYSS
jgi:hypothetical protein